MKSFNRNINVGELRLFVEVLKSIRRGKWQKLHRQWLYKSELLLNACIQDLRCSEWLMPSIFHDWSIIVQSRGYKMFGDRFNFLAFDLQCFGRSPTESREKNNRGDVLFVRRPLLEVTSLYLAAPHIKSFHNFALERIFLMRFRTIVLSIQTLFGTTSHLDSE